MYVVICTDVRAYKSNELIETIRKLDSKSSHFLFTI